MLSYYRVRKILSPYFSKKEIVVKLSLLLVVMLLPFLVHANEPIKQNVVFDCSSSDMGYVSSRMWLIEESAKEYKEKKVPYDIVLTIHSGCTEIVSKDAAEGDKVMEKIQTRLQNLSNTYGVTIEACEIALNRYGIDKEDYIPTIKTVRNSITRVIQLQNEGYAFIPFSK